jgi:membrane protein
MDGSVKHQANDGGPEKPRKSAPNPIGAFGRFLLYVGERFHRDGCQQRAAALTFTSLLAMVPLLAVSFAIFSAFPAYESLQSKVQDYIFTNFVPQIGTQIQTYIESFMAQTGKLSAVGVVFLALSAVLLLVTINGTLNMIWQTRQTRGLVTRLLTFWSVLTLTPLLFGASISLSSVLFTAAQASGVESVTGNLTRFAFVLPFIFQAAGLTVLFLVMPAASVHRRDAVMGGLVASVLLEGLKKGFGFYITHFPTYETIYGVMATIPIFLMWVYLSWMVVLFGAEVAASLPEWRAGARRIAREGLSPMRRLSAALAVLDALNRASKTGATVSERRLSRATRLGPDSIGYATRRLTQSKYIARSLRNHWILSRDLSTVTLATLYRDLGLDLGATVPRLHLNTAWGQNFAKTAKALDGAHADVLDVPLKTLLAPRDEGDVPMPEDDGVADEMPKKNFNARVLALIGLGTLGQAS